MKRIPLYIIIIILCLFSRQLYGQSVISKVDNYLNNLQNKGILSPQDAQWTLSSEHTSSTSGVHHIYFVQTVDGLPITGTESSIHFDYNNMLVANSINFIKHKLDKQIAKSTPSISVIDAVNFSTLSLNYKNNKPFKIINSVDGDADNIVISDGGIFSENISARLSYFKKKDDELVLVWDLLLMEKNNGPYWNMKIDANNGSVILKEDLVLYCHDENAHDLIEPRYNYNFNPYKPLNFENDENLNCTECYEVFILPLENPYYGTRNIIVNPADPLASPFGWHDVDGFPGHEYTITRGNNVYVKASNGYDTQGGESLDFSGFPLNIDYTQNNGSKSAAATNAFYVLNSLHDILYHYGFNEQAGNFQENNYNRGGLGQDDITVYAQREGRCGSSYSARADGWSPIITLGVCGIRDAAVDSDVIIHEYIHGLTTRLIQGGTAAGSGCLRNAENLGEGYSDWYSKVLTIKPGDRGADPTGFGNYILNEGPDGIGTNRYHYSTNMSINPLTYEDLASDPSVHAIGSIWANILWEVTWALIDEYGFDPDLYNYTGSEQDAGNIRALAIVTEAIKLSPCRPGFIDGRDAILRANRLLYYGESDCYLWDAFAKRGLGIYAFQGSAEEIDDETVDFVTIPREIEFSLSERVCLNENYVGLGGGLPYGGMYSGIGVTDNGDGKTFFVNAEGLSPGSYEVTYRIEDSNCYTASSSIGHYFIEEDTEPPMPICPEEFTHILQEADEYFLWDYSYRVDYVENCSGVVTITQLPLPNTVVSPGIIDLDFTLTDEQGNVSYCSIRVTLEVLVLIDPIENDGNKPYQVEVYPNPSLGIVFIQNRSIEKIQTATIYDVLGRAVKSYNLSKTDTQTELNIESLVTGVYFIRFEFENTIVVKQIIRK